jgi:hypothetical protein
MYATPQISCMNVSYKGIVREGRGANLHKQVVQSTEAIA